MEPLCQTCGAPLAPAADGRLRCPACLLLIGLSDPAPALTGAGAVTPSDALTPGASIGPYRLLKRLGEGGMGEVFLAEQQQPIRRTVAVKVLKPGAIERQAAARFEFERQALAILNHQAIAKVFDAGFAAGRAALPGDGVRAGDLADDVRRQRSARHRPAPRTVRRSVRRRPSRPPERHHPPRPQALEHPRARSRRSHRRQSDRLRDREGPRPEADRGVPLHAARADARNAGVHESRAGGIQGFSSGRPHRPLRPRAHPVRAAHRCAALRSGEGPPGRASGPVSRHLR